MRERPVILYFSPGSAGDLVTSFHACAASDSLPPYGVVQVLPGARPER